MMPQEKDTSALPGLDRLLSAANISAFQYEIEHFQSGGNNDIYCLKTGKNIYAVKQYKTSPSDQRDRLNAEWSFISSVKGSDKDAPVPEAYAMEPASNLALYSFVRGGKLKQEEIAKNHIDQAAKFIKSINRSQARQQCAGLGNASEACFSGQDHLAMLHQRIERLKTFGPQSQAIRPVLETLDRAANSLKLSTEQILSKDDQCVSPSDFGFHNALADHSGRMTFIDFEYAGWDDPAKLAADFFFQPEIPVPEEFYDTMLDAALSHVQDKDAHRHRAKRLRPVFGLRWCCIILNPFNPAWAEKHRTAIHGETLEKLRANRLNSAQATLNKTLAMISAERPL